VRDAEARRARTQDITDHLVTQMLAGPRPADVMAQLALPLPSMLISGLLGVPYADCEFFQSVTRTIISHRTSAAEQVSATEELLQYLGELVDRKRGEPGEDILSMLATEVVATGRMSRREIAILGQTLLQAGHETTANMIALGTLVLLQNPDQARTLAEADDPRSVAAAVEELLRYLTIPHRGRRRVALADFGLGGQLIREGEGLIAAIDVANRDEAVFTDSNRLDLRRGDRRHLAFGFGVHQCLGQALARVELQVVYPTLLRRIPGLTLAVPMSELAFNTTARSTA
jgi:cytochrome P450